MDEISQSDIEKWIAQAKGELNQNPWFFLGWRIRHNELQRQYTEQQAAKAVTWMRLQRELTLVKERFDHAHELEAAQHEANIESVKALIAAQKLNKQLIGAASTLGIDLINYGLLRKEQLMNGILLERQWGEAEVKIEEHRQMKEIDHKYLIKELDERVKHALQLQLLSAEQGMIILTKLSFLKDELYQLRYSGKPIQLIIDKEKDYLVAIRGMEATLGRLLQADNGKDAGGGDKDTDSGGFAEPDNPDGEK
jgi:hypothetical protein